MGREVTMIVCAYTQHIKYSEYSFMSINKICIDGELGIFLPWWVNINVYLIGRRTYLPTKQVNELYMDQGNKDNQKSLLVARII